MDFLKKLALWIIISGCVTLSDGASDDNNLLVSYGFSILGALVFFVALDKEHDKGVEEGIEKYKN